MANKPHKYENMSEYDDTSSDDRTDAPKGRFNIFNKLYGVDGAGIEKDELRVLEEPSLANFFKLLGRKLWRLISVNSLYLFGNFPLIFLMIYLGKFTQVETAAPAYPIFSSVYGAASASPSPVTASLLGIFGRTSSVFVDTPLSKVFLYLSFLVIFTFGIINVGCTRHLRSMIREEPIFFWQDFFEAVKKNLRQALIFGAADCIIMVMLVFDVIWFNANSANSGGMMTVFLVISWGTLIIYAMMRMYIYLMMITFDLSIPKLLKNALLFTALGIKRNLLALLGGVLFWLLCWGLITIWFPLGLCAFILFPFGVTAFMGAYAAYPKIKQVMIDPYYDENGNPLNQG